MPTNQTSSTQNSSDGSGAAPEKSPKRRSSPTSSGGSKPKTTQIQTPIATRDRLKEIRDAEGLKSLPATMEFLMDCYDRTEEEGITSVSRELPESKSVNETEHINIVLGEERHLDPKPFDPACPEGKLYAIETGYNQVAAHPRHGPMVFSSADAAQEASKKHPGWGVMPVKSTEDGIAELNDWKTKSVTKKVPNSVWLQEYRQHVPLEV